MLRIAAAAGRLTQALGLMTKNVVTVERSTTKELIDAFSRRGYELKCPDTGHAHGFSSAGEIAYLSAEQIPTFLVEGNGILIWREPDQSLYISQILSKPRISCDGLTPQEEEELERMLSDMGITYYLSDENVAYES